MRLLACARITRNQEGAPWFSKPDAFSSWSAGRRLLLIAWLAGELAHRGLGVPRVCAYSLAGIVSGALNTVQADAQTTAALSFLANFALGLFLFELGHRINLRWLVNNPWLLVSGIAESLLTFFVVRGIALAMGQPDDIAMVLGALSVATSPAALVRVVNDLRCSGQVTERALHLCAINCLLSVLLMKGAIVTGNCWRRAVWSMRCGTVRPSLRYR